MKEKDRTVVQKEDLIIWNQGLFKKDFSLHSKKTQHLSISKMN